MCHVNLYGEKWVTRECNCKLRDTSNDRTKKKKNTTGRNAQKANCKCSIGHKQKIGVSCDAKVHESLSDCNVGRECKCGSDIFNLLPIEWF